MRADDHAIAHARKRRHHRQLPQQAVRTNGHVARDHGALVHEARQRVAQRLCLVDDALAQPVALRIAHGHEQLVRGRREAALRLIEGQHGKAGKLACVGIGGVRRECRHLASAVLREVVVRLLRLLAQAEDEQRLAAHAATAPP